VTFFDFLSLKNDVNVPSKSNNQKNYLKNLFFVGILKFNDENSNGQKHGPTDPDPHPDPHQNVVDRNTGWYKITLSMEVTGQELISLRRRAKLFSRLSTPRILH
jgi:hypothetical protein